MNKFTLLLSLALVLGSTFAMRTRNETSTVQEESDAVLQQISEDVATIRDHIEAM